ncbi:outer membrane protein assembly factor BamE [Kaistia terrae]|uniref:Outer membrane protein assembly factor BamE n=1 Tax=Kaistia terrae TaxID=537017 RepID=A0ABW0PVC4_9HYPH|nr:outer membrane protein assembly factor BamE [Kaistia terrae]MCX5577544.1 outer membrane protein assembly factor BamE [Kaistia terrae]
MRDRRLAVSPFVRRAGVGMLAAVAIVSLGACTKITSGASGLGGINETYQSGYVPPRNAIEQVPVGASREQVQIVLGSPSTTAEYDGEVYYYISQTRKRPVAFMNRKVVDQKILAVYFNKKGEVSQVANYGIQDGKIFDYVSQTTPTSGKDQGFLEQVLTGTVGMGANPFGG